MTARPEINATLDHLHIESDDPDALARQYETLLGALDHEPLGPAVHAVLSGIVYAG